jgi:hypothetical protein
VNAAMNLRVPPECPSELLGFWTLSIVQDQKTKIRHFGNSICFRLQAKGGSVIHHRKNL